jgi:Ca2+-dependent lipid-binding protein
MVDVISATNLKNSDISIFSGKSDPYVKLSGLGLPVKTKVINNSLNPSWNQMFLFLIDQIDMDPMLDLSVYDKDKLSTRNDDFLGGYKPIHNLIL